MPHRLRHEQARLVTRGDTPPRRELFRAVGSDSPSLKHSPPWHVLASPGLVPASLDSPALASRLPGVDRASPSRLPLQASQAPLLPPRGRRAGVPTAQSSSTSPLNLGYRPSDGVNVQDAPQRGQSDPSVFCSPYRRRGLPALSVHIRGQHLHGPGPFLPVKSPSGPLRLAGPRPGRRLHASSQQRPSLPAYISSPASALLSPTLSLFFHCESLSALLRPGMTCRRCRCCSTSLLPRPRQSLRSSVS